MPVGSKGLEHVRTRATARRAAREAGGGAASMWRRARQALRESLKWVRFAGKGLFGTEVVVGGGEIRAGASAIARIVAPVAALGETAAARSAIGSRSRRQAAPGGAGGGHRRCFNHLFDWQNRRGSGAAPG
jgi:hypothetical protein